MKATIGTSGRCSRLPGRRRLLGAAADLADEHERPRSRGRRVNSSRMSMKLLPLIGSPPMPTHVDWPMPASVMRLDDLVGQGPRAAHEARRARPVDRARDDAHLGLAGRRGAGAVGPDEPRALRASTSATTLSMSSAGMCSVMQKIVPMPASSASRIASGAPAAGTKMTLVSAPVAATAATHGVEHGHGPAERASGRPCPASRPATMAVP